MFTSTTHFCGFLRRRFICYLLLIVPNKTDVCVISVITDLAFIRARQDFAFGSSDIACLFYAFLSRDDDNPRRVNYSDLQRGLDRRLRHIQH